MRQGLVEKQDENGKLQRYAKKSGEIIKLMDHDIPRLQVTI